MAFHRAFAPCLAIPLALFACRDWDKYDLASTTGGAGGGGNTGGTGAEPSGGSAGEGATGGGGGAGGTGGGGPCGFINALSDDFESFNDSVWSDDVYNTTVFQDGTLVMSMQAPDAYASYESEFYYDLTGHSIEIGVAALDLQGDQSMWFSIGVNDENYAEFWVNDGELRFGRAVAGSYSLVAPSVPLDTAGLRWRFAESGGDLVLDTSEDGMSWETRASVPVASAFDPRYVKVVVGVSSDGTTMGGGVQVNDVQGGPTVGAVCKTASFVDDFDDGVTSDWYNWFEESECFIEEVGGAVTVFVAAGADGDDCGFGSSYAYDLEDSSVSVKIDMTSPEAEAFLVAAEVDDDFGVGIHVEDGSVHAELADSGSTFDIGSLAYDPQAMRWVRIREENDELFWETSPDGVTYEPFAQAPTPFDASFMEIVIGGGASGVASGAFTITLDDLNVVP